MASILDDWYNMLIMFPSGTHQEVPCREPDQVQGPMQPIPVHSGVEGQRQGREAQAVSSSRYAYLVIPKWWIALLTNMSCHRSLHLRDPKEERQGQARPEDCLNTFFSNEKARMMEF